jgi:protein TonB
VLSPSISFAAHFTGAALLVVVPLLAPDKLPPTASPLPEPLPLGDIVLAVSLGGRPADPRPQPPRVTPPPRPFDPGLLAFADLRPIEPEQIDLGSGSGIIGTEGLGELVGSDAVGFCLTNCSGAVDRVAQPEAPEATGPVRVRPGGDLREPVKIRHVAPVYPQLAMAARVQGSVVIDCVIDQSGTITSVTVLRSHPLLEQAAVEAVRQWRYRPTLLNGTPVSVILTVTVDFRLR